MTRSAVSRSVRRRALGAAGAAWLLGLAAPCSAVGADRLIDIVLTPAYLQTARCNDLTALSTALFQGLSPDAANNKRPQLSRAQVRDIATRYDEVNTQVCAAVTPIYAGHDGWARKYARVALAKAPDKNWDAFFGDELAVKWAGITAKFRTELLMLDSVIDLELDLLPNAFHADAGQPRDMTSPEMRRLLQDIRRVSLTDEEAKVRFLLASLHEQPRFREMMPARFDVVGLARIEAKTRELGLQLMNRHGVNLDTLVDARTHTLLLTLDELPPKPASKLETAVRTARAQMDALISRYRAR